MHPFPTCIPRRDEAGGLQRHRSILNNFFFFIILSIVVHTQLPKITSIALKQRFSDQGLIRHFTSLPCPCNFPQRKELRVKEGKEIGCANEEIRRKKKKQKQPNVPTEHDTKPGKLDFTSSRPSLLSFTHLVDLKPILGTVGMT